MPPPLSPASAAAVLMLAGALAVWPTAGVASDYINECRSADGYYALSDDVLTAAEEENATPIPFETLGEVVLREIEGHCLSKQAGDQKFGFNSRLSWKRIAFDQGGYRAEIDLLCEEVGSGLPAAYGCDEEVVTKRFDLSEAATGAAEKAEDGGASD